MAKNGKDRITFELPAELKKAFYAKVEENDQDVSKVLRAFTREYVNADPPSPCTPA